MTIEARRGPGGGYDPVVPFEVELARLRAENDALRNALRLLSDVANLVRAADDPDACAYAVLTGVTAGVGLGLHRAMIFERVGDGVVGRAAIGPASWEEADRVWRAIERDAPDLVTLYEAGLRHRAGQSVLDARVRATRIVAAEHPRSPAILGLERVVHAEGEDALGLFDPGTTLAAPMRGREGTWGVLVADNQFGGGVPDPIVRLVFGMLADHAGRALFAAARFAEVSREARTDELTGLDSRRVGLALLEHAAHGALVSGAPVSLVLLDLDHFKRVNDTLGHPVGDAVLREAARRVRAVLSPRARAFRYGGEEFAIVLEGQTPVEAHGLAERVRAAIAHAPIDAGAASLRLTASVGVASAPPLGAEARVLLERADAALLDAKRSGRDRVRAA
jgi:diguanylate cyclase (GGDEF)-like protein